MKDRMTIAPTPLFEILEFTSNYFEVDIKELKGKKRDRYICQPRHFSRYISKKYLNKYYTLQQIGSITNAGHDTVIYSVKSVEESIDTEGKIKNTWGRKFVEAEEHFVNHILRDLIHKNNLSGNPVKISLRSHSKLLRQQHRELIKKDNVIGSMYLNFAKAIKEIESYIDNDQLVKEGYLKHKAKMLLKQKRDTLNRVKMTV